MAEDNNASRAIGLPIRLFDDRFTLDDVRAMEVSVAIDGGDGFSCTGSSNMTRISRDPATLVDHCRRLHDYPDGFMLFCGTMFVSTGDREGAGLGFTHHVGDRVRIAAPRLGTLESRGTQRPSPPWTFGIGALLHSLR